MTLHRYQHIAGSARQTVRDDATEMYRDGKTIREIAAALGRSYGFVHRLILEDPDTVLRSRGARSRGISDSVAEVPGQLELGDLIQTEDEEAS